MASVFTEMIWYHITQRKCIDRICTCVYRFSRHGAQYIVAKTTRNNITFCLKEPIPFSQNNNRSSMMMKPITKDEFMTKSITNLGTLHHPEKIYRRIHKQLFLSVGHELIYDHIVLKRCCEQGMRVCTCEFILPNDTKTSYIVESANIEDITFMATKPSAFMGINHYRFVKFSLLQFLALERYVSLVGHFTLGEYTNLRTKQMQTTRENFYSIDQNRFIHIRYYQTLETQYQQYVIQQSRLQNQTRPTPQRMEKLFEIQAILDEKKTLLGDGDYLTLCNIMKDLAQ